MAEEDFTEEDFEDLPPMPPGPQRVVRSSNQAVSAKKQQSPTPAPVAQAPPATRDVETLREKYAIYNIPPRMGIFDNELQKPIIEESEALQLILTLLVKMANDIDEIKGRL